MRKEGLTAFGSVSLAFLASQHHTLHMLLLSVGVGGAGMSLMTMYPMIRRFMLVMSLVMVAVTVYQMRSANRPVRVKVLGGISVILTLGLLLWSIGQYGL